jgi:hypothetical protein
LLKKAISFCVEVAVTTVESSRFSASPFIFLDTLVWKKYFWIVCLPKVSVQGLPDRVFVGVTIRI